MAEKKTKKKKIYTRTGDEGTTSLFGGGRVPKDHPRIDAYGTVDETNSHVGMARALLSEGAASGRLRDVLGRLQEELFILGADLATPSDAKPVVPRIGAEHVQQIEADIDAFDEKLPALKHFILPGGTPAASALHVARTVCRRAERLAVEAADPNARGGSEGSVNMQAAIYLNRLSDLLFVLARAANHEAGEREDTWRPAATPSQE